MDAYARFMGIKIFSFDKTHIIRGNYWNIQLLRQGYRTMQHILFTVPSSALQLQIIGIWKKFFPTFDQLTGEPYGDSVIGIEPRVPIPKDQRVLFDGQRSEPRDPRESKGNDYAATTETAEDCCSVSTTPDTGESCC